MELIRIIDSIKASKHILMGAHISPDGDAIGSLVGMAGICKFFHIPYTILIEEIPSKYRNLIKDVNIQAQFEGTYDTFISVDCGDRQRLGIYEKYFVEAGVSINIDHHHTNNEFGDLNYVQKDGSSTSELVFNLIQETRTPLTKEIARAIYTGIVFDTGGFMHSSTKSSTHRVVAKLLDEIQIDYSAIYHHIIHARSLKTLEIQSVVMQNMQVLGTGKIYISYVTDIQMKQYQANREDIEGIVNYIKNIEGAEVAAFLYPVKEHAYKLSLRSVAPYDVATICQEFGGGGHIRAAGATIEGELEDIIQQVRIRLMNL